MFPGFFGIYSLLYVKLATLKCLRMGRKTNGALLHVTWNPIGNQAFLGACPIYTKASSSSTSSTCPWSSSASNLNSLNPQSPHLFCMWHRLPRPRCRNLLSQGRSHGTSHDSHSGPAKASHVAAEIQGFRTFQWKQVAKRDIHINNQQKKHAFPSEIIWVLRGIWFFEKKNKGRPSSIFQVENYEPPGVKRSYDYQIHRHFRIRSFAYILTHEAGGGDGRFPRTFLQQKKCDSQRLSNSVSKPWIHHPVVRKSMIHMPRRGRSWPGTYPVLLHVVPLRCGWMKRCHSGHRGSAVAWVHQGPSAWYSASPSPRRFGGSVEGECYTSQQYDGNMLLSCLICVYFISSLCFRFITWNIYGG